MKTVKVFFAAIFTFVFFQTSFANNITTSTTSAEMMLVRALSEEDHSVTLRIARAEATPFTVFMKKSDGTVVYFEKVKASGSYLKCFRLEQLNDGEYFFAIRQAANEDIVKVFNLSAGKVTFDNTEELFVVAPAKPIKTLAVKYDSNTSIAVNYENTGTNDLKFVLTDEFGHTIFKATIKPNENFTQTLKMADFADGVYYARIEGGKTDNVKVVRIQNGEVSLESNTPRA